MLFADLLRSKLHGIAPDKSVLKLFGHIAMDAIAEIFYRRAAAL